MQVRFTQDVSPSPSTRYEAGRIYDLDQKYANAFITQGVAVALDSASANKAATPGNATINSPMGKAAISAGQTACVITNAFCKTTAIVQVQLETADATLTRLTVTPANGSFTVTGNAAATAATTFNFQVATP